MADIEVKLESNTQAVDQALNAAIGRALEAVGLQAEGYAKMDLDKDPRRIDTGNLRNSITHTTNIQEQEVYIGTNVEYAPYVEYGTVKMAPHPFLQNAVEGFADEYKAIFESYLSDL